MPSLYERAKNQALRVIDPTPGNMLSNAYSAYKQARSLTPASTPRTPQQTTQNMSTLTTPATPSPRTQPYTPSATRQPTIDQIKSQYTILNNPSQIGDFDIKGQYGQTGAPGSFLYGTPKTPPTQSPQRTDVMPALSPSASTINTPPPTPTPTPSPAPTPTNPLIEARDRIREFSRETPTTPTTPTQPEKNYLAEWGITRERIEADLEAKKQAIRQKYDVMRREADQATESERMATLASQYSVGETNPLASGGSSINSESQRRLNQRKDAISAMEAEETAQAEAIARGLQFEGANMAMQAQKDQEAKLQQEFENKRQTLSDTIDFAKTNRQFTREDRQTAFNDFTSLLEIGGAGAFDGYTDEDYAGLETALGWRTGQAKSVAERMKKLELQKENQIMKLEDGSIINLKTDKNGNVSYDEIVKAPTVSQKFGFTNVGGTLYRTNPLTGEVEAVGSDVEKDSLTGSGVQFDTINSAIAEAEKYADAAGRGQWREAIARGIFGATDMTALQSYVDTIKTNLLTLTTDPEIKKFFGPQMSNADVRLMMSGSTSLNPEGQEPVQFKKELERVKGWVQKLEEAKNIVDTQSMDNQDLSNVDWATI